MTRPAPPPPTKNGTPKRSAPSFSISSGTARHAHRVGIYGTGGVGKSTLASLLAQVGDPPVFIDLEGGSADLDVQRVNGVSSFADLRDCLSTDGLFPDGSAIVLDTATRAEAMAVRHVIENVPHEKGNAIRSIEDYGFGKGMAHVYEAFMLLVGDLERLHRRGHHVVLIMHDCTSSVPNPAGDDWLRYEPRLQSPSSGKNSIRLAVKEWLDHLLFVGYDVAVNDAGKATGSGTRAIYPHELPTHMAKSRTLRDPIVYAEGDASLWRSMLSD
ncbi:MAG: ATP-binding protein [Planctomycetota bacterium]